MNDKSVIITLSIIILVLIGFFVAGYLLTEANKKPIVNDKISEQDYTYLYNFYVGNNPTTQGRPHYGPANGSLTFLVYTDFTSSGAQEFRNETLQWLIDSYVHTGKAKLYHKNYVTADDLAAKNEAYYYAQSFHCYADMDIATTYDFYFALYDTPLQDIPELVEAMGQDRKAFVQCLKQEPLKEVKEDIAEVEQFGMMGITPWLYVGIQGRELTSFAGTPAQDRLYRTIRSYQTRLGD